MDGGAREGLTTVARPIFTLEFAAVLQASGCDGPVGSRAVVAGAGSALPDLRAGPEAGSQRHLRPPDGTIVSRHHAMDREVQGAEARLP